MLGISINLMMLSARIHLRGRGMSYADPAQVVNGLINGPAFFSYVDLGLPDYVRGEMDGQENHLVGIALMWFLIGLAFDRRRAGLNLSKTNPKVAIMIFSMSTALLGLRFFAGAVPTSLQYWRYHLEQYWSYRWWVLSNYPFHSQMTMYLAAQIWALVLCIYFVKKVSVARKNLRREPPKSI
jgi:hypothetical protein